MEPKTTRVQNLISEAGKHLRREFEEIKRSNPHFAERGAEAEIILRDFLNQHLPKRFAANTGLVIDHEDQISSQTDVIIYDALNSPIYRKGARILILPSDNVASVIEVKSKLNKDELQDAAKKISSVKSLKKSPITEVDQPVTLSPLIMTKTLGVVFAYDSSTSLETLSVNLREINATYPSNQWIDLVVVLDKGVIGYMVQMPFSPTFPGWFGGACVDEFSIPPFYVHLVMAELGDLTLNRFFFNLMAHLTFYRKRSAVSFESVLGKQSFSCTTLNGYQYNLKRKLVDVDDCHREGNFHGPTVRFNLYSSKDNKFIGQIGWIPWQDGAVISYSGLIPPQAIFKPYFGAVKEKGFFMPGFEKARFWLSSVIPLSKERFISITGKISGDFFVERDSEDENDLPWLRERNRGN